VKLSSLNVRGIAFVTMPLLGLVLIVGVLYCQFTLTMDAIEQQSRSRENVSKCYALESNVVEAFCDMRTSTDDTGMVNQEASRAEFNAVKRDLKTIIDAFKDDPERRHKAVAIDTFWKTEVEPFVAWFLAAQSHGEEYWKQANQDFPIKLLGLCDKFLTMFSDLIMSEESRLSPEKTIAQWNALKQVPFIAMGASMVLAIFLAVAYALTIKRPVSRIGENCRRMAANEQLLPALKGGDELSELDRLFHTLAQSVHEAISSEKAMIDNARDMICSLDASGKFIRVNNSSVLLLGMEPDELREMSLIDICPEEEAIRADDELRTSHSRMDMRTFDLILRRRDGSNVDTRWSCVWSERDNELFAVVHDITEEKNVERLKQDFVDMISHDLRSPLTSMLGSLTMIEQGARGPLPDEAQKEVTSAVKNVERLVDFINDLLDFQKLKSGRMQLDVSPCKLEEIVSDAIEMVKSSADDKDVEIVLPKNSVTADGDRNKLHQVAVNLIANAIRFAPEGSAIEVQLETQSKFVEMRVIDSGPGVPLEFRELIFDAFQQVPSAKSKQGTGLGLAICKLIIDAHGGEIGVAGTSIDDILDQKASSADQNDPTSIVQSGSIFWVRIPRN